VDNWEKLEKVLMFARYFSLSPRWVFVDQSAWIVQTDCGWQHHEQDTNKHGGLTMNKSDLIEAVASELESSKSEAGKMIEAVISAISDGLKSEEKVAISGFGTFTKKHRAARVGMNPATKQPIQINESTTCSFKPSQHLKDSLHVTDGQLVS
jgi:DNA-binding protein HU-beta